MVLLDIILGLVTFVLINWFGRALIPKSYQNDLFEDEIGKDTVFNLAFRIIAPIVLLVIEGVACKAAFPEFDLMGLMLSCGLYWVVRLAFWVVKRRTVKSKIWMIIAQSATSFLILWYLLSSLGDNPIEALMPRVEDVSFEFMVLIFVMLLYILAESPVLRKDRSSEVMDRIYEQRLFEIDKICREVISKRFEQDIALRVLLYTFALMEDVHRPKEIRAVERLLIRCRLTFFVKTVGLMQVPADKPISDAESVRCAMPKIAEIYDKYLQSSINFTIRLDDETQYNFPRLTFYDDGYSYQLNPMLDLLEGDVSRLYGKYCGTYKLHLYDYYWAAKDFIQNQYNEVGSRLVEVSCPIRSAWDFLPIGARWRLGQNNGFACFGGGDGVRVISVREVFCYGLPKAIERENLYDKLFFLYCGLDGVIIVISEDAEKEDIDYLANKLSASVDISSYHFDSFIEAPKAYIDSFLSNESFG